MVYGGPYLGILACRDVFTRKCGALVGQTVTATEACWVLTLQTREQHIRPARRRRADICA